MSLRGALAVARHSRSKLEHEIPRFTRNKLRNLRGNDEMVFKNVVAQFIGQMRLMNQATTEIWG